MELRHLRYFVAVAEELHFGRAAEKLFIAQPPLSQQIQQMERELGVPLFTRTSRRVRLTPAGEAYLADARVILARVESAAQTALRAARGEVGTLSVGFAASATYAVLPDILRRFRELHPDVELMLYELNAAEQAVALREKTIQIGFARPAIQQEGWVTEALTHEPFVAAFPAQHALALGGPISLAELSREPFIGFPSDPKPSYADLVQSLCTRAGFTPRVAQEVREMQTALSLVAAGMGIAIVPASVQDLQRRGVSYRPLAGADSTTELTIVYRRDDPSAILPLFLEIVRAAPHSH